MLTMTRRFLSTRWASALLGMILGLGAPVGSLLLRLLLDARIAEAPLTDLRTNAFFYAYQLVGTCLVFSVVGFIAGTHIERVHLAEQFYHRLAEHDELTGLNNGRALRARYQRVIERAARYREPLSLLLIDVDQLKEINDRFGHAAGSAALQHVAGALKSAKRQDDFAARWGGDEFALLMEGADEASARRVGNVMLDTLRSHSVSTGGHRFLVTVTIGLGTAMGEATFDALFDAADQALYEGKKKGRNRLQSKVIEVVTTPLRWPRLV